MEEQAAARLIYKSKCRMSDERLGARDCSWSLMADETTAMGYLNPRKPVKQAFRVGFLGEKTNLFSTLKTEYRKKLIIIYRDIDIDQPRTSRSRVMIER